MVRHTVLLLTAALWGGCVRVNFDRQSDAPRASGDAWQSDIVQDPDGTRDHGGRPLTWVSVVQGTFTMGSPSSEPCRLTNESAHQVTLTRGFEIQTTEVTQGQFLSLMGYNPAAFGACGGDCPVEEVSWNEAAAYCNALSSAAGQTLCYACTGSGQSVTCQEAGAYTGKQIYDCPGYRLPTEAEWEYAYRGGTQSAYHSGGNDPSVCAVCSQIDTNLDSIGWYCANSGGTTRAVGQKQANKWGIFDMAGNVWEWCNDRHEGSLGTSPVTDPWGSPSDPERVLRGGSWVYYASVSRAAYRGWEASTFRFSDLGFRCCRSR